MTTLGTVYQDTRKTLRSAGIETADIDSRLILAHAFGCAPDDVLLKPDMPVHADHAVLQDAIGRRLKHEPVSKITGHREFYGLDFILNRDVLDPRADSETVIDSARRFLEGRNDIRILDVCTGTGCLLITLLTLFPGATGVGTDISETALSVARENAEKHGVSDRCRFIQTSFVDGVDGVFDGLVCNPPYIRTDAIADLADDVRLYDPMLALDGGIDGLVPYRIIFPQIRTVLKQDGRAFFEIGFDQGDDIKKMAAECGLQVHETVRDLNAHERVVIVS